MKIDNIIEEAVAEEVAEVYTDKQIEEWRRMMFKVHTPFKREYRKVGRNEICPFCDSGLKFKHCECYQKFGQQSNY